MRAMVLEKQRAPLILKELPKPIPGIGEILIKVHACAVCRTDLHILDGELAKPKLPLIMGHQIVGTIEQLGEGVNGAVIGQRIGVPWLGWSCQSCHYCRTQRENLCDNARYTGYDLNGGFAEYCLADPRFCFPIPAGFGDIEAAPLLCAGLIGYRSYRMTGDAEHIGFYGFGASAHLLIQLALYEGRKIYAFTRDGDAHAQASAREMGAIWTGGSSESAPRPLDAAIIFAPVGALIPKALRDLAKGGVIVCAGIHMSDIPSFPYSILWGERMIRSVANLTRRDGTEFLTFAQQVPIKTSIKTYPLERTNEALDDLRTGKFEGSAVIVPSDGT